MATKTKHVKLESKLVTEMQVIAEELGFTTLTEFLRVWWKNPVEVGKLIEKAKKRVGDRVEKELKRERLSQQAEEAFSNNDDIEPFEVEGRKNSSRTP